MGRFFDRDAKQQLFDLPSEQLKRRALELLAQGSTGNPRLGKPCGFAFSTGNPPTAAGSTSMKKN